MRCRKQLYSFFIAYVFCVKALLSYTALLAFVSMAYGQTYRMGISPANHNATVNTCSGTFYDSGGNGSNYNFNENITVTFCSNNGGSISFNFTSFDVENNYDYLRAYDGPSTSSPAFSGSPFTGTSSPGTLTSSGTCITFRFTSDNIQNRPGWSANISCGNPPGPCAVNVDKVDVTGCYYYNNQSYATVSVEVSWGNPPGPPHTNSINGPRQDSIRVAIGGQTRYVYIEAPYLNTSENIDGYKELSPPQIVTFEMPADGSTGYISAHFTSDVNCSDSSGYALPPACAPTTCIAGNIGGTVFMDYNANGVKDATEQQGQGDVIVAVIDANDVTYSTTTDAYGIWTLNIPAANFPVRVEFSNIPDYLGDGSATVHGNNNGTRVQFVNAPACNVDIGVNDVNDYCENTPFIFTPCYVNGAANAGGGNMDALVAFFYGAEGDTNMSLMHHMATNSEVGSVWGLAYHRGTETLYSSAMIRRHVGLGPLGIGGIYQTDVPAENTTNFIDVTTLGVNVGQALVPSVAARNLPTSPTSPSYDIDAFNLVGTVGIGDLEISEDGEVLYFINLYENKLHALVIDSDNNPSTLPTTSDISSYDLPQPCDTATGYSRPWALTIHDGKVYVGMVCDGSKTEEIADVRSSIYTFDIANNTFDIYPVIDIPMTYPKGGAIPWNSHYRGKEGWFAWVDNPSDWTAMAEPNPNNGSPPVYDIAYPQPILMDIEFDIDGSMIIGFGDRSALQFGFNNYPPQSGNSNYVAVFNGGDILRAYAQAETFVIENNAKAGPTTGYGANNFQGLGFGEFYNENFYYNGFLNHSEDAMGGLALLPGSGQVIATVIDPINNLADRAGIRYLNNTTGDFDSAFVVYKGTNVNGGVFGKAAGLGDLELGCGIIPFLEIGNRIWNDVDNDGIQDPNEVVIPNINVALYDTTGNLLATKQTDANGTYYFDASDGLQTQSTYYIVVGTGGQFNINTGFLNDTFEITQTNVGMGDHPDLNDNDGAIASGVHPSLDGMPYAVITTGDIGTTNHSLDFGFISCPKPYVCPVVTSLNTPPSVADTAYPAIYSQNTSCGIAWTNTSNIGASDNNYATVELPHGGFSACLDMTDLGFNLPACAELSGIEVSLESFYQGVSEIADVTVKLLNSSGNEVGLNKANGNWSHTESIRTYGGVSDMWGTLLDVNDINHANFGVRLQVRARSVGALDTIRTAFIDHLKVIVHYGALPNACEGPFAIFTATASPIAFSFNWTLPAGATILSGAGTNQIVASFVNVPEGCYDICVSGVSSTCGAGPVCCTKVRIENCCTYLSSTTGNDTICSGAFASLTPSPSGGTSYTYLWSTGDTTATISPSPVISTTYYVTITDAMGCTVVDSAEVYVNDLPATPTNGDDQTECSQDPIQILTATATPPTGSIILWYDAAIGGNTITNPALNVVGIVTYYAESLDTVTNCVSASRTPVILTIYGTPPTPGAITGDTLPCEASTVTYSIAAVQYADSYLWTVPEGWTISSGQGTNSITVVAGDSAGQVCVAAISNLCDTTNTSCVDVSSGVQIMSGVSAPDSRCAEEGVLFVANPPVTGAKYAWTFTGSYTILSYANDSASVTVEWADVPGTYDVTLDITRNGCQAIYHDSIVITQVVFAAAGDDITICKGASAQIGGNPTGPPGANYLWLPPLFINGSNTVANPTVKPPITFDYIVEVTQNGCIRYDTATVIVDVTLNPDPEAGSDKITCPGHAVAIGGLVDTPNSVEYYWISEFGDTVAQGDPVMVDTIQVAPLVETKYYLDAYNADGCPTRDSVTVFIDAPDIYHNKQVISAVGNNEGQYEVVYQIDVTNDCSSGDYNLEDQPGLDADILIDSAKYTSNAPANTSGVLNGTGPWTLATDQAIAANTTHTYIITAYVTVDLSDGIGDEMVSGCDTILPPALGGGLFNQSMLDVDDDGVADQIDTACGNLLLPINTTYAIDDENSTLQAMPVAGDVSTNDFDLEGDLQDFETFLNQDGSGTPIASGDTLLGIDTAGNVVVAGILTFPTNLTYGKYVFTPDSGFIGTVQVPYSVCDDGFPQACDTAVLRINVVPDDGIQTNSVIPNNDENITWGDPVHGDVLVNDFDPELDSILFDGFIDPVGGLNVTDDTIFTISGYDAAGNPVSDVGDLIVYPNGSYTFIPIPNFEGYMHIPYDISDDGSPVAVDSAVLTIVILDDSGPNEPMNDPPFAGDDHNSTIINTPVSGAWSSNDMEPNKDDITFNGQTPQMDLDTMAAPPGVSLGTYTTEQGGSIEFFTDGSYTYTPPTDYIGPDQISYEICDVTTVNPQPLCDSATVYLLIASPPCPNIEAWVYLEGALVDANGLGIYTVPMRTTLNTARLLPGQTFGDAFNPGEYQPRLGDNNQVYNIAPWSYSGTEGDAYDSQGVVADGDANYPPTVTDWVLVSLRSDPVNPASILCTHAALLHNDGRIEFPDATELCCDLDINASYWVVIEHHNHLLVMSHVAVPLTDGYITYDFRDRNTYLDDPFGSGYVAQKEVLPGVFAMYAGNGQQSSTPEEDTDLNTNDANQWDTDKNQFSVYLRGDYDMNGDVNTDDRNLWDKNKQTITSVPR